MGIGAEQNTANFGAGTQINLSTGSTRAGCRVWSGYVQELVKIWFRFIPNLLAALLTLLVGLLIAASRGAGILNH